MSNIDNVKPNGKWEFDESVAKCFANMLERSIPDYANMRALVYKLGEKFVIPKTGIVDIGCSTGLAVEPFVRRFGAENKYYLYDNSEAMLRECMTKYSQEIEQGFVKVYSGNFYDLDMSDLNSLVLSILSMQFMPTAYRQTMINNIYGSLADGGAFIFVEKIICDGNTDDLQVGLYYDMKRANGYSDEQILDKRKSLENVLSPLKSDWNIDMLHKAGFKSVDMFWRCLNFCGYIAIK